MNRIIKIVLLVLLSALLVLIRAFEDSIFYDPLLSFFKSLEGNESLPEFDTFKLLYNVALRYGINTLVSLAMLWVIFQSKEIVKLSLILYVVLFVVLMIAFYFLVFSSEAGQNLSLFYVRRFLIQPLFLLILVPAFYFHQKI